MADQSTPPNDLSAVGPVEVLRKTDPGQRLKYIQDNWSVFTPDQKATVVDAYRTGKLAYTADRLGITDAQRPVRDHGRPDRCQQGCVEQLERSWAVSLKPL